MEEHRPPLTNHPTEEGILIAYRPATPRRPSSGPSWKRRIRIILLIIVLFSLFGAVLYEGYQELRSSRFQARFLARVAGECSYQLEKGESYSIFFPQFGPTDQRRGYIGLPGFISRLKDFGYTVDRQARFSPTMLQVAELGLFPPYHEKYQAGLRIFDRHESLIYKRHYPDKTYSTFPEIPPILIDSLLFIENRELFDQRFPMKNPAVEWDRLAKATFDLLLNALGRDQRTPGGSTLVTQMEKYNHSPYGQTASPVEKLRQIGSGSLRSYLDGENTFRSRQRIVLQFINSMPLGAAPGFGEVNGFGDGITAWYGNDLNVVTKWLILRPQSPEDLYLDAWARYLKQAVSLFIAQRRPAHYLRLQTDALNAKTDSYLRLMTDAGLLKPWERDAALRQRLTLKQIQHTTKPISFVEQKAINAVRTDLLAMLDVQHLYHLDQLDLDVTTTIDHQVQQAVTEKLQEITDEKGAQAAGLNGFRLLDHGDPAKLVYSFTLYEHVNNANLLRVQTDNYDQPLNINRGVKLELGSSAKLRTMVTYLEIISELHGRYKDMDVNQLAATRLNNADKLSRWVVSYLSVTQDRSLRAILLAALERRYSASPAEQFFTGGGLHSFANFDKEENYRDYSVRQALQYSVNLVFIRLMRDIANYYLFRLPGIHELFTDVKAPGRREYLARFADQEGAQFQRRFYRKYKGKTVDECLELLLESVHVTPHRLSAIFRYLYPDKGPDEFTRLLETYVPLDSLKPSVVAGAFSKNGPDAWSLVDRGFVAKVHPLELLTIRYLGLFPDAGLDKMLTDSVVERQTVYGWLFKTSRKNKQDRRIRTMLEQEAFQEIHAAWKRLKYPFASLVPSYATSIGSSADRPEALAELMGILLNDGRWHPFLQIEKLHFASGTPYETILHAAKSEPEQLLDPEVAAAAREALLDVVNNGTARRIAGAFQLPDGTVVPIGGKTGTGDNRRKSKGSGGQLISSKVVNRTAVFVFFLGDRFFGAITAYVGGREAGNFSFTSSLPVQILKTLAPTLQPLLLSPSDNREPATGNEPDVAPDPVDPAAPFS